MGKMFNKQQNKFPIGEDQEQIFGDQWTFYRVVKGLFVNRYWVKSRPVIHYWGVKNAIMICYRNLTIKSVIHKSFHQKFLNVIRYCVKNKTVICYLWALLPPCFMLKKLERSGKKLLYISNTRWINSLFVVVRSFVLIFSK